MAKGYKLTGTNTILDLVKAAETAETYRDSVNKSYAKPWKLFSSPPDSVWQEYQGLEYDRDEKRFDIFHNPSPTKNLKEEKSILDVFGGKSKDADDAVEYGMGLAPEELMDIAMSVTPMGGVKAGKGAVSFLKGLLGKAKSKTKFPVGYGEPTKNVAKERAELMNYFKVGKLQDALHRLSNPERFSRLGKLGLEKPYKETSDIMELQKALSKGRPIKALTKEEYNEIWKSLNKMSEKPKGMRQFGKFNRPLGKQGNKPK